MVLAGHLLGLRGYFRPRALDAVAGVRLRILHSKGRIGTTAVIRAKTPRAAV